MRPNFPSLKNKRKTFLLCLNVCLNICFRKCKPKLFFLLFRMYKGFCCYLLICLFVKLSVSRSQALNSTFQGSRNHLFQTLSFKKQYSYLPVSVRREKPKGYNTGQKVPTYSCEDVFLPCGLSTDHPLKGKCEYRTHYM